MVTDGSDVFTYNGENAVMILALSFFIFADNEAKHKISNLFDFGTDLTIYFGVTCP